MKIKEIEGLIDFIAKSGLEEVNIETEQIKLAIKKTAPVLSTPASEAVPFAVATLPTLAGATDSEPTHNYIEFKSPMIGTFYQAPNPDAAPFVAIGNQIEKGQKICVIEAMKLFNEIEADISGTIVKILVDDASPVEYDQPLFLIDPA